MNAVIDTLESSQRSDSDFKAGPPSRGNQLLAALPAAVRQRWAQQFERVELPLRRTLYEPGSALRYVYFPTTAIVSLLYVTEIGASTEIAVVGNEGMVGVALLLGGESTLTQAVVQSTGYGLRLNAQTVKDEFTHNGPVRQLLLRYTQALLTQTTQTAVCNNHHSLEKRLCRWFLSNLDRSRGSELASTHELVANMLGVRREGVTEAARKLQADGLIRYSRGRIAVLDRPGLEQRTCECYAVLKKEYDRLLPSPVAARGPQHCGASNGVTSQARFSVATPEGSQPLEKYWPRPPPYGAR
jgi:CRP-like cAMP-binding protein